MAAEVMRKGGVIAYATEGVIGLGCDPANDFALLRLLDIKQRPYQKGLILIASEVAQLEPWVDFSMVDDLNSLLNSWPGPETWIVPKHPGISRLVSGTHSSIAVRVTEHPQVIKLCDSFGGAIISTSANLAGHPTKTSLFEVRQQLGNRVDHYLGGEVLEPGKPSRIRDAITGKTLRA